MSDVENSAGDGNGKENGKDNGKDKDNDDKESKKQRLTDEVLPAISDHRAKLLSATPTTGAHCIS